MRLNKLLNHKVAKVRECAKDFLDAIEQVNESGGMPTYDEPHLDVYTLSATLSVFTDSDIRLRLKADADGAIAYKGDEYSGFEPNSDIYVMGECDPDVAIYGDGYAMLMSKREILASIGKDC